MYAFTYIIHIFHIYVQLVLYYLCYLTLQVPLFGNIFDELYLTDELWKDVDKIPLLNETTTKIPESISCDEKPKVINNVVMCAIVC